MRFKDRVALITAAASGIGRATAEIMAREGGVVVAVDKDEARLDDMVASLRAGQGRVRMDPIQHQRIFRPLSGVRCLYPYRKGSRSRVDLNLYPADVRTKEGKLRR